MDLKNNNRNGLKKAYRWSNANWFSSYLYQCKRYSKQNFPAMRFEFPFLYTFTNVMRSLQKLIIPSATVDNFYTLNCLFCLITWDWVTLNVEMHFMKKTRGKRIERPVTTSWDRITHTPILNEQWMPRLLKWEKKTGQRGHTSYLHEYLKNTFACMNAS